MDLALDDDHWRVLSRNVAKCSRKARPNATLKLNRTLTMALILGIGAILGVTIERTVQAQSAPPAYYVAEVKVNDVDVMKTHRDKVAGVVKQYGGRLIVQGGKTEAMAGVVAIIEFKSLADAQRWRNSPEIQAIVGSAFNDGPLRPRAGRSGRGDFARDRSAEMRDQGGLSLPQILHAAFEFVAVRRQRRALFVIQSEPVKFLGEERQLVPGRACHHNLLPSCRHTARSSSRRRP
jgi:uncharacterized protein (DUF1330 family)